MNEDHDLGHGAEQEQMEEEEHRGLGLDSGYVDMLIEEFEKQAESPDELELRKLEPEPGKVIVMVEDYESQHLTDEELSEYEQHEYARRYERNHLAENDLPNDDLPDYELNLAHKQRYTPSPRGTMTPTTQKVQDERPPTDYDYALCLFLPHLSISYHHIRAGIPTYAAFVIALGISVVQCLKFVEFVVCSHARLVLAHVKVGRTKGMIEKLHIILWEQYEQRPHLPDFSKFSWPVVLLTLWNILIAFLCAGLVVFAFITLAKAQKKTEKTIKSIQDEQNLAIRDRMKMELLPHPLVQEPAWAIYFIAILDPPMASAMTTNSRLSLVGFFFLYYVFLLGSLSCLGSIIAWDLVCVQHECPGDLTFLLNILGVLSLGIAGALSGLSYIQVRSRRLILLKSLKYAGGDLYSEI